MRKKSGGKLHHSRNEFGVFRKILLEKYFVNMNRPSSHQTQPRGTNFSPFFFRFYEDFILGNRYFTYTRTKLLED